MRKVSVEMSSANSPVLQVTVAFQISSARGGARLDMRKMDERGPPAIIPATTTVNRGTIAPSSNLLQ